MFVASKRPIVGSVLAALAFAATAACGAAPAKTQGQPQPSTTPSVSASQTPLPAATTAAAALTPDTIQHHKLTLVLRKAGICAEHCYARLDSGPFCGEGLPMNGKTTCTFNLPAGLVLISSVTTEQGVVTFDSNPYCGATGCVIRFDADVTLSVVLSERLP